MSYEPIERRKVYEILAERLAGQITGGALAAGSSLPSERDLAEGHGVGRSSVREALRMLESQGLIESRGNGAFVVGAPQSPLNRSLGFLMAADQADARELYEVRRLLESEAAALAAARRTEAQLSRLEQASSRMREALGNRPGARDQDAYISADVEYHLVVAEATGNRVVVHLMEAIRDQLTEVLGSAFHVPGGPERSLDDHAAITDALVRADPAAARRAMHAHIARVELELDLTRGALGTVA